MKTILIKIGAVLGAVGLAVGGIFLYGRSKYKAGEEDKEDDQRDATMERSEESRKLQDKVHNMTEKELYDDWEKDKRLQGKEGSQDGR